jgi:hypothetical protein
LAVGGNFHNLSDSDLVRELDQATAVGSAWIRIDLNWAVVQQAGPASYNWAPIDRVVQAARARSLSVLGTIVYTPAWARPAGQSSASAAPANPADFAAFAKMVAARYAPLGVHAFEIWNEPNISGFWLPKPDATAYTALLRAAYPAIKQADPQAVVVTGGTSPATDDGTNIAPVTFLQRVYTAGGRGYFDAVGHHPYCWPALPGDAQSWSAWYQMYGSSPSLRSVMEAAGDGGKQIWATEFGAPTNGPSGSYVSESAQATAVIKAYELFGAYGWAGPLFWYATRDLGATTDTRENFFGLIRLDFSPKPAYGAYRAVAST